MLKEMIHKAKHGQYLRRFVLVLAAFIFLGSIEGSAYCTSASSTLMLSTQPPAQNLAKVDGLFAENGEECDGESDADVYVTADAVHLPQIHFIRNDFSASSLILHQKDLLSLANSRAPPAL